MITFQGRSIEHEPGQSIAGALIAAGITSWRATRFGGRPRGIFCGMGVCFDCLVRVNGGPAVRACVTEAQPGDAIDRV